MRTQWRNHMKKVVYKRATKNEAPFTVTAAELCAIVRQKKHQIIIPMQWPLFSYLTLWNIYGILTDFFVFTKLNSRFFVWNPNILKVIREYVVHYCRNNFKIRSFLFWEIKASGTMCSSESECDIAGCEEFFVLCVGYVHVVNTETQNSPKWNSKPKNKTYMYCIILYM